MSSNHPAIRILHVEDEPEFAEMTGTFLEREDDRFDIEIVTNPVEGLDRLDSEAFDCIISDYDMPTHPVHPPNESTRSGFHVIIPTLSGENSLFRVGRCRLRSRCGITLPFVLFRGCTGWFVAGSNRDSCDSLTRRHQAMSLEPIDPETALELYLADKENDLAEAGLSDLSEPQDGADPRSIIARTPTAASRFYL